jgi:hypothetical protein
LPNKEPNKEHRWKVRDAAAFTAAKPDTNEIGCQRLKTQRGLETMRLATMSLGNRLADDLAQQLCPPPCL